MPPTITEDDVARARRDLEQIQEALRGLIDRPSNWNGRVNVLPLATMFNGMKEFACAIALSAEVLADYGALHWRVLIHELFHSLSNGYSERGYASHRAWEEAPVEQLQRLFRRRVLEQIGVDFGDPALAEDAFHLLDRASGLNRVIEPIERYREQMQMAPEPYYLWLLGMPLGERPLRVLTRRRRTGEP